MKRLAFLHQSAAAAVAVAAPTPAAVPWYDAFRPIVPIRAEIDRIFRVTVCLRPFRAAGPRLDVERVGEKTVFHNYGHGGSGWSLSWGSADLVIRNVLSSGAPSRDIAVIGCGALGLTAAITAQRMGLRATIYAKERPPYVRSSRATGSWTPDSRIALTSAAAPGFPAQWEQMARTSFAMYQSYLGMPGNPIEWTDRYTVSDLTRDQLNEHFDKLNTRGFAYYRDRIPDITPRYHDLKLANGRSPFPVKTARGSTSMTFNIADYSRQLINDFLVAGGTIETREFHTPADLASLTQTTIVNCTGYGARQLWSDESIVPIRGQIAWLIPQEGVNYGLFYNDIVVLGRRDGIVVQPNFGGDDEGWNDDNEQPDRAAAEAGVNKLRTLFDRMARVSRS
jgi:glycine/D-amino acid oxidase-like deaminating enzyme